MLPTAKTKSQQNAYMTARQTANPIRILTAGSDKPSRAELPCGKKPDVEWKSKSSVLSPSTKRRRCCHSSRCCQQCATTTKRNEKARSTAQLLTRRCGDGGSPMLVRMSSISVCARCNSAASSRLAASTN